uniref:Uncharacterized protein n=1 Tax=Romanomermis culicivorax TaxID=13658 RepID=A0A915HKR4_ROMCU
MIRTRKNVNPNNAPRKIYPVTDNKTLATNLNLERRMSTISTDLQAENVLASHNPQAFGATPTSHAPTIPKIAFGSRDKMLNEQIGNPINRLNDFVQNTYALYLNQQFPAPWEQHIHYNAVRAPYITTPTDFSHASSQPSELQLALPALPSSATVTAATLDMRAINQSTSATNMVILSKEIASAALMMSPGIAHGLIDTAAQCSVLSSGLVKRAFDKQLLQLLKCGKIKVADGAIASAHALVVVTMESTLGEHLINQPEEMEAEQPIQQAQPSPHQPPSRWLEVTQLAEPNFLVAKVSVSISPHCQQWVATAAADRDLTNHKPAALDKSFPCHTDK